MRTLDHFVGGRENNFNLLRFAAALLVLFSHSFALSTGNPNSEPLRDLIDMTPGSIAVDIFFVTSGFLVTGSLLSRGRVGRFLLDRVLRIYPALIVAVILTTVAVSLFFTSWSTARFASSLWTWEYVLRNATLLFGVSYLLPGAFENVPLATAVNGSLWTLPYEVRMYGLLALLWGALHGFGALAKKYFGRAVILVAALAFMGHLALRGTEWNIAVGLLYMFFVGGAMRVLQHRLPMSWAGFWICLVALVTLVWVPSLFVVVYAVAVPYVVMFFAYVPAGGIRQFNRVGDYSYGMYIYSFPVQQATMAVLPGIGQVSLLLISMGITFALAAVSWHLIEKRALALKNLKWMLAGRRQA